MLKDIHVLTFCQLENSLKIIKGEIDKLIRDRHGLVPLVKF